MHGTGTRARRLQDIESDTGYDTRRRAPDGVRDDRPGLDSCRPDPELGPVFGRKIVLLLGAATRDL